MTAIISLGQFNKNIIFPILGGIICFFISIILYKSKLSDYPIILCLSSSSGMSLSFILLIIYNHKNKIINETIIEKEKKSLFIEKIKFILICASLDFTETLLLDIFCVDLKVNLWIFDIIFLVLFSYSIFEIKIYKHHYLSIFVIIITGIIIDIISGYYNDFSKNIFIKLFAEILISFDVVMCKYAMDRKYCSPYEMCCYTGFFELILYSLLFLLSNYLKFLDDFKFNFNDFELRDLWIFIIIAIMKLFYNLLVFITISITSAIHNIIIIIIGGLASYFIDLIYGNFESYKIFIIIFGLCVIFFMTLIFNEIFELNLCGFEKNTKRNIYLRSLLDEKGNNSNDENRCSLGNYTFSMERELSEDFSLNSNE